MPTRFLSILIALGATIPVFADETMERAVETAARNFRIQTYETYRTDRPVYDERIQMSNEALRLFHFAADDVGRVQIQQWFFQAGTAQKAALPTLPDIQILDSHQRLKRTAPRFQPPQQVKRNNDEDRQRSEGFVVTKYQSNPRFQGDRQLREKQRQESLVNPDSGESTITKALKNPGELFNNIGRSILRGKKKNKNNDSDNKDTSESLAVDGNSGFETETIDVEPNIDNEDFDDEQMKDALDEIIASDADQHDFDKLNNRIIGQNLAVGLLAEDLHNDDLKSVSFLSQCVDRLEELNASQISINEQRYLFNEEQQKEFAELHSLEETATELMTAVNSSVTLVASGEIKDQDGTIEATLGDLRMRLSQILAEQSF